MNGAAKLDQYLELLKEVFKLPLPLDVRNRLHILLSTLVNQNIEQRQVLDGIAVFFLQISGINEPLQIANDL